MADIEGFEEWRRFEHVEVTLKKAGEDGPLPYLHTGDLSGVLQPNLDNISKALTQFLEILLQQYSLFTP